uniref:Uncharacterized protein n=1 Tax=Oreochromis niloticus TaxID=8128 RepID=A0A669E4K3_ORENI
DRVIPKEVFPEDDSFIFASVQVVSQEAWKTITEDYLNDILNRHIQYLCDSIEFITEHSYPVSLYQYIHPHNVHVLSWCSRSLPRVYVINKEICVRTVCREDEYLKAELCRELSGWPRRIQRSSNSKRCRNRRGNPQTWANKA